MNKLHAAAGIGPAHEEIIELPGEMVRVDDEGLHANGGQMIECKGDQRPAKDRASTVLAAQVSRDAACVPNPAPRTNAVPILPLTSKVSRRS